MKTVEILFIDSNNFNLSKILSSDLLTEEDKTSILRYKVEESRKEKAVSFYLKRKFVKDFYINEHGKPLSDEKYFNIAHTDGMVIYVEDKDNLIGVDIERVRPVEDTLKKYISNEEELDYIKNDEKFFEIWTNKESLTKCVGIGLTTKIKEIPALPINGKKVFLDNSYMTRTIKYDNFIISVCLNSEEDFVVKIKQFSL